jgi:hypothetical protein
MSEINNMKTIFQSNLNLKLKKEKNFSKIIYS